MPMKGNYSMRALFVAHSIDNYGASRSLQSLLNNYANIEADLLIGIRLGVRSNFYPVKGRFGNNVRSVYRGFLPLDYCYDAKSLPLWVERLKNTLALFDRPRIERIIKSGRYDFVHLNSLGLHPMIRTDLPVIIHVREMLKRGHEQVRASLRNAAGVIFIDEATRKPFNGVALKSSIVLNNPIDMSQSMPPGRRLRSLIADPAKTVFAIIAEHQELKGTDFVISCFREYAGENSILLVVGKIGSHYLLRCRSAAAADPRIIFFGEEERIGQIYAASDYIIRAEPYACIGRTVFEGLYAGCGVIVPGSALFTEDFFEYELFKERVHFYKPRDAFELGGLFGSLAKAKISRRPGRSNCAEYVQSFHRFVCGCAGIQESA
jgi:hypothetical protein